MDNLLGRQQSIRKEHHSHTGPWIVDPPHLNMFHSCAKQTSPKLGLRLATHNTDCGVCYNNSEHKFANKAIYGWHVII